MHVTGDISVGSIAIIITIVSAAIRIGMQIGAMQTIAKTQGDVIVQHTMRLDKYEERLVLVVGDVQRMIGRLESTQDRLEKITGQRPGEGGRT